jgi:hypothetical protein
MNVGRRRFLGAIAGTAASVLLPRGTLAAIDPAAGDARFGFDPHVWSPWSTVPVATGTGETSPVAAEASSLVDPPALLPRALAALDAHGGRIADRSVVGLVDFSVPSRMPRLHIVDVAGGRVVSSHLVAHGRGSDPANSGFVEHFSNRLGSEASSSGSFMIGETYYGKHGRSRRLIGLDPDNDQAEVRGIVIHAASYVGPDHVAQYGRIGRSQGCFAVNGNEIALVLDRLGPGRLLFAAR